VTSFDSMMKRQTQHIDVLNGYFLVFVMLRRK